MKLSVRIAGELLAVEPIAARGLGLICQIPAGVGRMATQVMVLDFQATDQAAFRAAWDALGGPQQGLAFEGGEAYEPPPVAVPGVPTKLKRSWLRRWIDGWLDWLFGG